MVSLDAPRPRVLIVDDDPDTVQTLSRALRRHEQFDVQAASSMQDALTVLDGSLPDVVLVDLSMSMVDGHRLLRQVRQAPRTATLPVFVLTGRHEGPVIRAAAQAGASGFIPQPFNGLEITYKIDQAIRGSRTRAAEVSDLLRPEPGTSPGGWSVEDRIAGSLTPIT